MVIRESLARRLLRGHVCGPNGFLLAAGALFALTLTNAGCSGSVPVPIRSEAPVATTPEPAAAGEPVIVLPLTAAGVADLLDGGDQTAVRLDEHSVVLRQGDLQLLVFLEDDGTTLQAVLPYIGLLTGDPQRIAAWNAHRRFGRAYLDHEDGPVLASDLLLGHGASPQLVRSWSRLVLAMAAAFRTEVWPVAATP